MSLTAFSHRLLFLGALLGLFAFGGCAACHCKIASATAAPAAGAAGPAGDRSADRLHVLGEVLGQIEPAAGPAGDRFAGHWEGTWQSAHGHHGRLLCQFTRLDARHYQAVFTAYWGALHGNFTVVYEAKRVGRELRFQGSKDLGALYGGLYHYTGTAADGHFTAHYTAAKDEGTFQMTRRVGP